MKLAVMQPYFFPYIGYFQAMSAVDRYVLHDGLNYIRDGFMHRNRYLATRVGPQFFIVPVKDKSSNMKISEVIIADQIKWRRKILNQLSLSYAKSPNFEAVFSLAEDVVNTKTDHLSTLSSRSISAIKDYIGISCDLVTNARHYENIEKCVEDSVSLHGKFHGLQRKSARAIMICHQEKAATFINAIGGMEIYSPDEFRQHGIDLWFLKTNEVTYRQHNARSFHPNLSILDVLFNCSRDQVRELLTHYTLVR